MGWYLEVRPPRGHWVRRVEPSWWDSFPYRGTPGVPIVAAALFLFFQTCLSSWVSDYQNLEGDYSWRQGHQSGAEAFGGEETRRSLPLPSLPIFALCTIQPGVRGQDWPSWAQSMAEGWRLHLGEPTVPPAYPPSHGAKCGVKGDGRPGSWAQVWAGVF